MAPSQRRNTSTFTNNTRLPIHRWYRFPAGFSAEWIKETVAFHKTLHRSSALSFKVFDPFVGCGTTVLASEACGALAIGIDSHPFLVKIAKAKLNWRNDSLKFSKFGEDIISYAQRLSNKTLMYPELIIKCYTKQNLNELDKLRRAWIHLDDGTPSSELAWLALVCILRRTSYVGTAPWQYVLPKKRKKNVARPFESYILQVKMMVQDMDSYKSSFVNCPKGQIFEEDARVCKSIPDDSIDYVVTSPPYPNNYDYADATRLEMSFLGEIQGWSDLRGKVRSHLVRSCSQHMLSSDNLEELLEDARLDPIREEITDVCTKLQKERFNHKGRKNYHLMIAAYFSDLAKVWRSLRRVCRAKAKVCFVVGDSAPYGVYIPVDKWLAKLAQSGGFNSFTFEKLRDRNIKWNSNRKHKIPLKEGRLWVG